MLDGNIARGTRMYQSLIALDHIYNTTMFPLTYLVGYYKLEQREGFAC